MLDSSLKQRLVGAIVLVILGVVVIPMLLGGEGPAPITQSNIPPSPKSDFSSKIIPLDQVPAMGTLNPVLISPPTASVEQDVKPAAPPSQSQRAISAAASITSLPPKSTAPATKSIPPSVKSAAPAVAPATAVTQSAVKIIPKPAAGKEAWTVRLGSFASEQNALALRDRLRAKGYHALVEKITTKGVALQRVSVGPEAERARAEAVRDKLEKDLKIKGSVVHYP